MLIRLAAIEEREMKIERERERPAERRDAEIQCRIEAVTAHSREEWQNSSGTMCRPLTLHNSDSHALSDACGGGQNLPRDYS